MRKTLVRVLIAGGLATGALMASSSSALAFDSQPCGATWWHNPSGGLVQYCPDWAPNNRIPVYRSYSASSGVVGHIYAPGADWYMCQTVAEGFILNTGSGTYWNSWWAQTWADNNEHGWVPEVYLRGGGNNEPDGNLRVCHV